MNFLTLTPEQSRIVGTWALLLFVGLDLLSTADEVPRNSPRDWILRLTKWKSLGLWSSDERRRVKNGSNKWVFFLPVNYFPLTGAFIPFMYGALVGHFFHPGLALVVGPSGITGSGIALGFGLASSVMTYYMKAGAGPKIVPLVSLSGVLCGVLVWPLH